MRDLAAKARLDRLRPWIAAGLVAGWGAMLALSWPGHLSYDSIVQLADGRAGFYHSWHPPIMAFLLGLGDSLHPGAGLYLVFVSALFAGGLLLLLWTRPRASWAGAAALALLLALPQFVLYQAVVWKDVLFADAAVAGFALLAFCEAEWRRARLRASLLGGALVLLSLAALTRQNGIVVLVAGAAALFYIARRSESRALAGALAALGLAGSILLAGAASLSLERRSDAGEGLRAEVKLLQLYDLAGAAAARPQLRLGDANDDNPALDRLIHRLAAPLYSPARSDALAASPIVGRALAAANPAALAARWRMLVLEHPGLYLTVRAADFGWLFFTPDIAACRPAFTGVDGPQAAMASLGLSARRDGRDLALARYVLGFVGTPAFSHAAYALLALALAALLLRRRSPGDIAVASMLLGALAFAASFFAISIACDYRYLYFLDLAALAAGFYASLDPYGFQVTAIRSGSFWVFRSADRKS